MNGAVEAIPQPVFDQLIARLEAIVQNPSTLAEEAGRVLADVRTALERYRPTAEQITALSAAIQRLVQSLLARATALAVGAGAAAALSSLAFAYLILSDLAGSLQDATLSITDAKVAAIREYVEFAVASAFGASGRIGPKYEPCWNKFKSDIRMILIRHGHVFEGRIPGTVRSAIRTAILDLFECLYRDHISDEPVDLHTTLGLEGVHELAHLINILLSRYFRVVLAGFAGLFAVSAEEAAEAAELDPEEVERIVRITGLRGVHHRDGFGYTEFGEPPPDDRPLVPGDVDVDPNLPLIGFTDEELEMRKRNLARMIRDLETEIAAADEELRDLEENPRNDSSREDLLRLRIHILKRESERLRAGLHNANVESQKREGQPIDAPPVAIPGAREGEPAREPGTDESIGPADLPRVPGWTVKRLPDGRLVYSDGTMELIWDPNRMRWDPLVIFGGNPPDPNPINPRTGERMAGPGTF